MTRDIDHKEVENDVEVHAHTGNQSDSDARRQKLTEFTAKKWNNDL